MADQDNPREVSFTQDELTRYSRHFKLKQVGQLGQVQIRQAKVLVVGAGGLGCPVLQYLTAAGVGEIYIVDGDKVSLSNLQRQILFTQGDIGINKAEAARRHLLQINSALTIHALPEYFSLDNALELVQLVDIVVDASDNFQTRYLINDSCVMREKPFVYGSIFQFSGQVAVFNYLLEDNTRSATYRCLFPEPPSPESMPSCDEAGVLGVLPGVVGTLQATEVMKIILGLPGILCNKLILIDLLGTLSNEIKLNPSLQSQDIQSLEIPEIYCSTATTNLDLEIDPDDFEALKKPLIIDVRNEWEREEILESSIRFSMEQIHELNSGSEQSLEWKKQLKPHLQGRSHCIFVCGYGKKSLEARQVASQAFSEEFPELQMRSLKGGINALKLLGMI